jgi:hypothetical protein
VEVGSFKPPDDNMHAVAVLGNYAYLAAGSFWVINVANPTAPTQVLHGVRSGGNDLAIAGNYAYVTQGAGDWPSST